jgi:hypothetical protein
MDLRGKTVNITNKDLLEFFYPNFIIKDILFFDNESSIIYTGKTQRNLLGYLKNNTKEFINTVGVCDIDLDIKETLITFVYDKFNKIPKEKTMELILSLPTMDFSNYVKTYWVSGISSLDDDKGVGIYDLFKSMGESKIKSLPTYFTLLDSYPIGIIQNSIETFLEKVVLFPEVTVNYKYYNLLSKFKSNYGAKLREILYQYYIMNDIKEFKLPWLLYQF